MNEIRRDLVKTAIDARRDGARVTLDNFRSQPGKTPRASSENANRAMAENRAGRFSLTIFDSTGNAHLHSGVNRDDAQKLVAAGVEYVGAPWRAP